MVQTEERRQTLFKHLALKHRMFWITSEDNPSHFYSAASMIGEWPEKLRYTHSVVQSIW